MHFRNRAVAVVLALAGATTHAHAQLASAFATIPPVSHKLFIMPTGADSAALATFVRLRGDTIVFMGLIARGVFTQMSLPLETIDRIDMAQPADTKAAGRRGALYGGATGGAIGGGVAAISGRSIGAPAVVGALAGALFGYILNGQGASVRTDCWRTIYQRDGVDVARLTALRRARTDEPDCAQPTSSRR